MATDFFLWRRRCGTPWLRFVAANGPGLTPHFSRRWWRQKRSGGRAAVAAWIEPLLKTATLIVLLLGVAVAEVQAQGLLTRRPLSSRDQAGSPARGTVTL